MDMLWKLPSPMPQATAALAALVICCAAEAQPDPLTRAMDRLLTGEFRWAASQPLVAPTSTPGDEYYSIKDPSIVFHGGRWHLFCTVRAKDRTHQVECLTFEDWDRVHAAQRHWLSASRGYYCAPQVFYFEPHARWYMICQASDETWQPEYGAAFTTTADIADPDSWAPLKPLGARQADGKSGLDFWIICDDTRAHMFFTTLDGRMWREETSLEDFPHGWGEPQLAIQGDIFEASHTYSLQGTGKFLTLIEAQGGHGWRYFKAYIADSLDGEWQPLAATKDKSFASMANTTQAAPRWTDNISHGELLRSGINQRLEVDATRLRFLFQGVSDAARAGKPYGQIPWRLGLLEPDQR